jgi:hypothetical protein
LAERYFALGRVRLGWFRSKQGLQRLQHSYPSATPPSRGASRIMGNYGGANRSAPLTGRFQYAVSFANGNHIAEKSNHSAPNGSRRRESAEPVAVLHGF